MATGTPRHVWADHAAGGTLITAAKLNELEQDVADALATAGSGGSTYTDEQAQDAAAALLAGQTGKVSATYVDGANRVNLDVTGLTKSDVGLTNVDNTADTAKPVSTAQQAALNTKLTAASNLSDMASATTARTNLGAAATNHTHGVTDLTATGTRDATTYLRGDNTWAVPAGGGGGSSSGYAIYNVVATYSADKTGATDARAAIQSAIDAASTAGGGVVYLPAGTYLLNATLTLKTRVTLKGDGLGATNVYQNSNTAAAITATDQKDMVIEDMTFLGTEAGTNTGILLARSTQPDIARVTLRRVQVTGFQTSINASNPITSVFDTVLVDTGQTGFYIHGVLGAGGSAGTSVTFLGCYSAGFTQSGYRVDNMAYCAFVGCASDNCGIAYELLESGTQGISFTGCGCESTVNQSTSYPGIGWKINAAIGVSLEGCFTFAAVSTSIWITGNAAAVKVGGFSENSPQAAVTNSIKVDTGASAVLEAVATVKPVSLASGTTSQIKVNGTSAL